MEQLGYTPEDQQTLRRLMADNQDFAALVARAGSTNVGEKELIPTLNAAMNRLTELAGSKDQVEGIHEAFWALIDPS